jgi:hypothetical protein
VVRAKRGPPDKRARSQFDPGGRRVSNTKRREFNTRPLGRKIGARRLSGGLALRRDHRLPYGTPPASGHEEHRVALEGDVDEILEGFTAARAWNVIDIRKIAVSVAAALPRTGRP